ncbi:MAG: hypothetical protein LCH53_06115 [Bacteroidetes bacterium]|nr:hypothetical protein [Bacteroidota bacterium]
MNPTLTDAQRAAVRAQQEAIQAEKRAADAEGRPWGKITDPIRAGDIPFASAAAANERQMEIDAEFGLGQSDAR